MASGAVEPDQQAPRAARRPKPGRTKRSYVLSTTLEQDKADKVVAATYAVGETLSALLRWGLEAVVACELAKIKHMGGAGIEELIRARIAEGQPLGGDDPDVDAISGEKFSVRVPMELRQQVEAIKDVTGLSGSDLLRRGVDRVLADRLKNRDVDTLIGDACERIERRLQLLAPIPDELLGPQPDLASLVEAD